MHLKLVPLAVVGALLTTASDVSAQPVIDATRTGDHRTLQALVGVDTDLDELQFIPTRLKLALALERLNHLDEAERLRRTLRRRTALVCKRERRHRFHFRNHVDDARLAAGERLIQSAGEGAGFFDADALGARGLGQLGEIDILELP